MDRKEQILEIATELVQTRGYSAFSYQDLSTRLGITKASIHHHFPSKEELGQAVADKCFAEVVDTLTKARRSSDDPWDWLEGYVQMVLGVMNTPDRICAAGSVQSEINVVPEGMGKKMASTLRYIVAWLSEVLEEGRSRGVMKFPGSAEEQAALILAAAQGAMQFGRANGRERGRQILEQIKRTLKAA